MVFIMPLHDYYGFIDYCIFNLSQHSIFPVWENSQSNLHISVSAMVAAAVVWMSELPARLNPIILPLMASIKREQVNIS